MLAAEGADFGGRRIIKTDMKTGISVILADNFRGKLFNSPSDIALDMQGRIYFTDPRYIGSEPIEQPFMGVYRIDLDGSIHLIAANATKPNGIAISPDQKTRYIAIMMVPEQVYTVLYQMNLQGLSQQNRMRLF